MSYIRQAESIYNQLKKYILLVLKVYTFDI
jgi:hypothetical protein